MKRISESTLLKITGGAKCSDTYDYWNGVACAGAVFLAFTPAWALAIPAGNACVGMMMGRLGGCSN